MRTRIIGINLIAVITKEKIRVIVVNQENPGSDSVKKLKFDF